MLGTGAEARGKKLRTRQVGSKPRMWGWGQIRGQAGLHPLGVSLPVSIKRRRFRPDLLPFRAGVRPQLLSPSSSPTCPHRAVSACMTPLLGNFQEAADRPEKWLTLAWDPSWLTAFPTNHLGPPDVYCMPGTGLKSWSFHSVGQML